MADITCPYCDAIRPQPDTQSCGCRATVFDKPDDPTKETQNFAGSSLVGSSFKGQDLRNADFRRASLVGASFKNADLRGANFDGVSMIGANLKGARTEGATFNGASMTGVSR